ncbi:hypothetical protein SFOMI_2145 [Sphingobium fuliginis]|uniref:Uncharacterized protein n=1 Tax=Sphingobium fuliginis (strain ATCC 27551) TaxID=336203 RepID=A0A292ZFD0_SPHSA|nr:hypothetical protein SFOMI_2145 [Sphingobium fuliginis]
MEWLWGLALVAFRAPLSHRLPAWQCRGLQGLEKCRCSK